MDFDQRAGLPAGVPQQIALALVRLVPEGAGAVLDVGAGTGQIGEHLAKLLGGRGKPRDPDLRYLGLDLSGPMLAVFHGKLGDGSGAALVRANARAPWPIASGGIGLLFLSRAAHLLPPGLLVDEALRVASPRGAVVVFGGVRSPPESLRAELRREMRRLLGEQGFEGRNAKAVQRKLTEALAERGGEILPAVMAAAWNVAHRARDSLAAWRAKSGLGGRAVTAEVQEAVLGRLEEWIEQRYGSLEVERGAVERYELAPIRLPASR